MGIGDNNLKAARMRRCGAVRAETDGSAGGRAARGCDVRVRRAAALDAARALCLPCRAGPGRAETRRRGDIDDSKYRLDISH